MIVGAVLLFLALISHTHADETNADIRFAQFLKLFTGDPEVKARADTTSNWLGLFGAIVARFFIQSTIGYFSLIFPMLIGWWGWIILREGDMRIAAYYSNYILIIGFLLSTLFGLFRLITWFPHPVAAWSGTIGDFIAGMLARFIGTIGGTVMIFTAILILAVIVIDYDIHRTLDRFHALGVWMKDRFITARSSASARSRDISEIVIKKDEDGIEEKVSIRAKQAKQLIDKIPTRDVRINKPDREISADVSDRLKPEEKVRRISIPLTPKKDVRADEVKEGMPLRSNGTIPLSALIEGEYKIPDDTGFNDLFADQEGKVEPTQIHHTKQEVESGISQTVGSKQNFENTEEANFNVSHETLKYVPPPIELLNIPIEIDTVSDDELTAKAELVKDKLAMFDIGITNISVTPGPVVTLYELVPNSDVKISKIVALADDLALALAAKGIRIIAPIPGKSAVGIEIPNAKSSLVNIRSVLNTAKYRDTKFQLPLAIGKTITGEVYCDDLARMPHLLVAGSTGSGKSVGINVMLTSLLYKMHPSDVKFVMIDPKKIELAQYRPLRNYFLAICPDINEDIVTTPVNSVVVLKSLELEMEKRYDRLAKAGVRHINDYNAKVKAHAIKDGDDIKHYKLPFIIVIIDELADLMITAAKEVEEPIARLAQLARAVGIHLILATQRPSVDVITGVIKANFSTRIAYQVATRVDSRTILDMNGAEQLLGNGDMLYQPSGTPKAIRIQNAFISTEEVEKIVAHITAQKGFSQPYRLPSIIERKKLSGGYNSDSRDELFDEAARLIVRHQQGSVSLIQRRLKVGYSRAARIIDELELAGIVGPYDGSKAREVLVEREDELNEILRTV